MEYFTINPECQEKYPGFKAGILVIKDVENVKSDNHMEQMKQEVVLDIRQKFQSFTREDLNKLPIITAYNQYYKKFDKSYHVRAQLESIISGKNLPGVSAILDSMFMAEIKNMLLTAGHDLDALKLPVSMRVASGQESYIAMNSSEKKAYPEDLFMADAQGVISSILNGPDARTKITPQSKNLLFAVYVPPEIDRQIVVEHLQDIQTAILAFSKNAITAVLEVF